MEEARRVFSQMPSRDAPSYNMMINVFGKAGQPLVVEDLLKQMETEGIARTGVTYTAMISGFAEVSQWQQAISTLDDLKRAPEFDVPNHPGSVRWPMAYLSAMTACSRSGEREQTRALFEAMKRDHNQAGLPWHYNVLMQSCGSDGPAAKVIFEEMRAAGIEPRADDWKTLLAAHRSNFEEPKKLYHEFLRESPNGRVDELWVSLLRTAFSLRDRDAASWVLEEMRGRGVDPSDERAITNPQLRRALDQIQPVIQGKYAYSSLGNASGVVGAREPAGVAREPVSAHSSNAHVPHRTVDGVVAPALPVGWSSAIDPNSGMEYYWRESNPAGTTTWDRPGGN